MDRNYLAEQHLLALILGQHPKTHEPISGQSPLGDPDVIRSLVLAKEALSKLRKARRLEGEEPERGGKPWTQTEDDQLRSAFVSGAPLAQLQSAHRRTEEGILSRLVRLGLVDSRQHAREMFR